MRSLILILTLPLILTSCDSWKDTTATIVSRGLTPMVSGALSCSAVDVIESDIKDEILKISWLKKDMAKKASKNKGLANSLCVTIASTALPLLINVGTSELPADWKCTGELIEGGLDILIKEACSKISI